MVMFAYQHSSKYLLCCSTDEHKVIQVWINFRVINWWQNFHYWLNFFPHRAWSWSHLYGSLPVNAHCLHNSQNCFIVSFLSLKAGRGRKGLTYSRMISLHPAMLLDLCHTESLGRVNSQHSPYEAFTVCGTR